MTNARTIAIDARIINSSTGRYVERLLENLQHLDTTNKYIVLVPSKDKSFWKPDNANFTVMTADFANYSLGEQIGFAKLLYSLHVDLVHFCMPQQPLFYFRPHVTTVHDLILLHTYNSDKNWAAYHLKQIIGRAVFWLIGRTSAHIIVPTKYTKQDYQGFAHIDEQKITVTYEGADVNSYKPEPVSLPFKQYLMYVGQQSDYKNIKRLIQAHQQLKAKFPDLGLVLVGSKNEATKRNEAWVREHGFDDVVFTGFVSNQQLSWLYDHCATYVFPSLMEGFGLPGLEAMAAGTPVASSNATCLPEVYGDAAHYFNPRSTHDIARAIAEILESPQLQKALRKKGLAQAKKYSWRRMAEQTLAVYKNILHTEQ